MFIEAMLYYVLLLCKRAQEVKRWWVKSINDERAIQNDVR